MNSPQRRMLAAYLALAFLAAMFAFCAVYSYMAFKPAGDAALACLLMAIVMAVLAQEVDDD